MDDAKKDFVCPYELFGKAHHLTIKARSADEAQSVLRNIMPNAQLQRPYERKNLEEHTAETVGELLERMR